MKKISIVIPVFNSEQVISRCLESIKNQSNRNFEVIIINDGSTDNSEMIINEKIENLSNFQLFNIKNGGVSHARNVGISKCTGEYITFIDADDYIESNMIEEILKVIENTNADYIKYNYVKEVGTIKRFFHFNSPTNILIKKENFEDQVMQHFLTTNDFSCVWNIVAKSSIVKNTKFDENKKYGEDRKFSFDLIEKSENIYIYNEYLYHYTYNSNSQTNKKTPTKIFIQTKDAIDTSMYIYNKYKNILFEKLKSSVNNDIIYFCINLSADNNYKNYISELTKLYNILLSDTYDEKVNKYIGDIYKNNCRKKAYIKFKIVNIKEGIKRKILMKLE